jgi:hypothetical protein
MYSAAAVVIRAGFGLLLGMFLSVAGFYAGWFWSPPGPTLPAFPLIAGTGLGAAAGGFIGWFKPEVARTIIAIQLGLALMGGLAGAWVGWELGPVLYPEGLYRPGGTVSAPPFVVAVVAATGGANILVSGFYTFRLWRYREN